MTTIQFNQSGDKYVYEYTSTGAHRTIQVKHKKAAQYPLQVFARIDNSLPWALIGSSEAHNGITAIVTVGVPADVQVRILSNYEPEVAGYADAQ